MKKTTWQLLFTATLCACAGSASSLAGDAGDGGGASADASDAAPLLAPDGGVCPGTDEPFRGCASASDCTLATVPDCPCGPSHVVGVAKSSASSYTVCMKAAFERSLAGAGAACAACVSTSDCIAEDGRTAQCTAGRSPLGLACTAGRCTSFVLPDAGADGG